MLWSRLRRRLRHSLRVQSTDDDRGSILLVAVGILMLLSVMATAFVANMSLERKATRNYVDSVKARLIAEAGLARAIEEQRTRVFASGFSDTKNLYGNGDFWLPLQVTRDFINASLPNDPFRASIVGAMGQSYNNGIDRYKIKILDTQSQFNLNTRFAGGDDSHKLMYRTVLRSLGAAIAESVPRINGKIQQAAREKGIEEFQDLLFAPGNPFDRAAWPRNTDSNGNPNAGATRRGVEAIIALLESKPNQRFLSKSELLECMDEADYRVVRDFVTANSYLDPKSLSANAEIGATSILVDGAAIKPPTNVSNDVNSSAGSGAASLRAPVNINLAPQEVIMAMLAPIAGQRVYTHTGPKRDRFEQVDSESVEYRDDISLNTMTEPKFVPSSSNYTVDRFVPPAAIGRKNYLVSLPPLGVQIGQGNNISFKQTCKDIVQAIIARRTQENLGGAFKGFMDWDRFVEERLWTFFATLDPRSTAEYKPEIYDIVNGKLTLVDNQLANEIMQSRDFLHWYRRSFMGLLKSAVNPNDRYSQFNPDQALFVEIDKGSVVTFSSSYEPASVSTGNPSVNRRPQVAQTCEWCFSTKGVFEIIALGEITTNATQKLLEAYNFPSSSARQGTGSAQFDADIHAQVKLRSILRIFDELTHTSQQDFSRNGHGGLGREPGNIGVVGFPIIDDARNFFGAPVFQRSNMRSYPVDEKYWWTFNGTNSGGAFPPYDPNEVGGRKGNESLFALAGAGHIQMSTTNISRGVGETEDVTELKSGSNGGTALTPEGLGWASYMPNLFELRFDHSRSITNGGGVLAGIYPAGVAGSEIRRERIASIVADVAGGEMLSGGAGAPEDRRPTDFRGYISVPNSRDPNKAHPTMYYPEYPSHLMTRDDRFMVRGTKNPQGRWENNLVTIDGLYMSDRTAFRRQDYLIPQFFPTYRATAVEQRGLVSSELNPGETRWQQYRRKLGVFRPDRPTGHDWPRYPNIHATKGGISFWYKPDFDWEYQFGNQSRLEKTQRYCGFFSVTALASPSLRSPRTPSAGTLPPVAGNAVTKPQLNQNTDMHGVLQDPELSTYSYRGTQMHFMRMPSGELRLVRQYFEMVGVPNEQPQLYINDAPNLLMQRTASYLGLPASQADGSAYHSLPILANPYFRYNGDIHDGYRGVQAQRKLNGTTGAIQSRTLTDKILQTPYFNLKTHAFLSELHRVVLNQEAATGSFSAAIAPMAFKWPPYYAYPPVEMYLPQGRGELAGLRISQRDVIDSHLNRKHLRVGRYDVVANPSNPQNQGRARLRRGRWYHMAVTWNDESAQNGNRAGGAIFIDGVRLETSSIVRSDGNPRYNGYNWNTNLQNGGRVITRDESPLTGSPSYSPTSAPNMVDAPKFVQLNQSINVYHPQVTANGIQSLVDTAGHFKDELVVGGIFRRQHPGGVSPANGSPTGLFKHVPAGDLICIPCNGTIDDFMVVRPPDPFNNSSVGGNLISIDPADIRSRYSAEGGIWTQWVPEFDGLASAGSSPQIVSVRFTAYLPYKLVTRSGSQNGVLPLDRARVQVRLMVADPRAGTSSLNAGASLNDVSSILGQKLWPSNTGASGGDATGLNDPPVIDLSAKPIVIANGKRLLYQVVMQPGFENALSGDAGSGNGYSNLAVGTPVFDSITFVYKSAGNQVILREQVFD